MLVTRVKEILQHRRRVANNVFLENLVSANVKKKNKKVDEAIKQLKKTVLYDWDVTDLRII